MKSLKTIWKYISKYRRDLFLYFLFSALSSALSVFSFTAIVPFLKVLFKTEDDIQTEILKSNGFLDKVNAQVNGLILNYSSEQALKFICLILIIIFLIKNIFRYLSQVRMAWVRAKSIRDIRSYMHSKTLKLPFRYFSSGRKGDLISRFSVDVQEMENAVQAILEVIFRDPFTIIITLASLFAISWKLSLFVLILLPISSIIIGKIGKTIKTTARKSQNQLGEVVSVYEESISSQRIIKAYNAGSTIEKRFEKSNHRFLEIMMSFFKKHFLASPISETLGIAILSLILWYGGNLVLKQQLNGEFLILYLGIFYQLITPAKNLSNGYYKIQKGASALDRINEVLDTKSEVGETSKPLKISNLEDNISFKNVHFNIDEQKIIKNLSFDVKKGEKVALVGPSGGGKSTIINLLLRFFDPSEGMISVNNHNIKDFSLYDLRNLFGLVSQDAILFNDSSYFNISLSETPDKKRVEEAAQIAFAAEFIEAKENGYDEPLGDMGNKLSGGQRQRIAIARAVYHNPKILLLDEATSALDTASEKMVQNALNFLMKDRTTIIIAHRLSTVQNADKILVVKDGEIVEKGTHHQLLEQNGVYHSLYQNL